MPFLKLRDGAELFYKDWGPRQGSIVTFSHGWPLSSDNWDSNMIDISNKGYRVIAYDRRGHGRSTTTWQNNSVDAFVDDLDELLTYLDVKNAVMVGHCHGGGEFVRYLGRLGTGRVRKAVLVGAIPPVMIVTTSNTDGIDARCFPLFQSKMLNDWPQTFLDWSRDTLFSTRGPDELGSEGQTMHLWQQGMQADMKTAYDCCRNFAFMDFTEDLKKIDVPVLVLHGTDDAVVPISISSERAVQYLPKGTLKVYQGGCHMIHMINFAEFNSDLLDFIKT
ncbi:hypothetical protein K4F52_006485 [Lecanicillium sp. MT-2017a]|nr:hypothetical protein K4F52_006485 [Lecanicillium sp. MT-2017a]